MYFRVTSATAKAIERRRSIPKKNETNLRDHGAILYSHGADHIVLDNNRLVKVVCVHTGAHGNVKCPDTGYITN